MSAEFLIIVLLLWALFAPANANAMTPDQSSIPGTQWRLNIVAATSFGPSNGMVVDNHGTFWMRVGTVIRDSKDRGATWVTALSNLGLAGGIDYIPSLNLLLAWSSYANYTVVSCSKNNGATWNGNLTTGSNFIEQTMGIGASPQGTVYIGEYSIGNGTGNSIWVSKNSGDSWTRTNLTQYNPYIRHVHKVLPVSDSEVYVTTGDSRTQGARMVLKSTDSGATFSLASRTDGWTGLTKIGQDFLTGSDGGPNGIYETSDFQNYSLLYSPLWSSYSYAGMYVKALMYDSANDVVYFATKGGFADNGIWISPDHGNHWTKWFDAGTHSIESMFLDDYYGIITFHLSNATQYLARRVSNVEAMQLLAHYRAPYVVDGDRVLLDTYLSPLRNVRISLTALGVTNLISNPSFEQSLAGWAGTAGVVDCGTARFGNCSLRIDSSVGGASVRAYQWIPARPDTQYSISAFIKNLGAMTTPDLVMYVQEYNATRAFLRRTAQLALTMNNLTTWNRIGTNFTTNLTGTAFLNLYLTKQDIGPTVWFDGIMLSQTDLFVPFVEGSQSMLNASLNIGNQTIVAHDVPAGDTVSFAVNGLFAGATMVTVSASGSAIGRLAVTGDPAVEGDGVLFSRASESSVGIACNTNHTMTFHVYLPIGFDLLGLFGSNGDFNISPPSPMALTFRAWTPSARSGPAAMWNATIPKGTTYFNLTGLIPRHEYLFYADGRAEGSAYADALGILSLGWSTALNHTFEIDVGQGQLPGAGPGNGSVPLLFWITILATVAVIVVIATLADVRRRHER